MYTLGSIPANAKEAKMMARMINCKRALETIFARNIDTAVDMLNSLKLIRSL
jgi:translation elongation factor EF-Ts